MAAGLAVVVAYAAYRGRPAPGSNSLMVLGMALFVWSFTYAISWLVNSHEQQHVWVTITYLGVVVVPPAVLVLVIEYTRRQYLLTRWVWTILIVEPIATLLILATDSYFGLFFAGHQYTTDIVNGGFGFWLNTVFGFGLVLIALGLLLRTLVSEQRFYRAQTASITLAIVLPYIGAILGVFGLNPFPEIDLTPLAFTISCLLLGYALFRLGLFKAIPVARDQLVESMNEGVILFDARGRIADINPAACAMTGLEATCIGMSADDAFPDYPDEVARLRAGEKKIVIKFGAENPHYIEASPVVVNDSRHKELIATVVVLQDITETTLAREAEREQHALADALRASAQAISSTLDFNEVLDKILETVGNVLDGDVFLLALTDSLEKTAEFVRVLGDRTFTQHIHEGESVIIEERRSLKYMRDTKQTIVMSDIWGQPDIKPTQIHESIQSTIETPLYVADILLGFLIVESTQLDAYQQKHADALRAIGDQAAVAIQNTRLLAELKTMATTDGLTGALNRHGFMKVVDHEILRSARTDTPLSLLVIDVDNFKKINDQRGHLIGDVVLCGVVNSCQNNVRAIDAVARFGGDEIIVLLLDTRADEAQIVAERIRKTLAGKGITVESEEPVEVTISIGIACQSGAQLDFDALFKVADGELYKVKQSGGNNVRAACECPISLS